MCQGSLTYLPLFKQSLLIGLCSTIAFATVSIRPISDSMAITIKEFTGSITEKTIKELRELPETPHTVIIDLQDNNGGNLHDAVAFGALFVTQNTLIEFTQDNGEPLLITRPMNHPFLSTKALIILVNETTASAAEATATILKHHPNHLIIGKTTYGKTNISTKNTPTKYTGMNITKIKPDIEFEWPTTDKEAQYLTALALRNASK
tara:strand:- start:200 stop:817 length:618 start_codon:yes stop_codon:yes gene_type:complete